MLMFLFYLFIEWLFCRPVIRIVWEKDMAFTVGVPANFHVEGVSSLGNAFPLVDPVSVTANQGTVTIAPDGTAGVYTPASEGPFTITATSGPFTFDYNGVAEAAPPVEVLAGIVIKID